MSKQLIRFDWAIKKLLRQKANFQILEGFLSSLLKEEIIIQNIIESEGNDIDETYQRIAADQRRMDELGIRLGKLGEVEQLPPDPAGGACALIRGLGL